MRTVLILSAVLLLAGPAFADDTLWTRMFTVGEYPQATNLQCQGTDIFLTGTTGSSDFDVFAASYTPEGSRRWTASIDIDGFDISAGLAVGPDREPVVAFNSGETAPVAWLVRLDTLGDTLWSRSRGRAMVTHVVADDNDRVYAMGMSGSQMVSDSLWFTCYDAAGSQLWTVSHALGMMHDPGGLCLAGNGDLVAAVNLADTMSQVPALLRLDGAGDTLWTRRYSEDLAWRFGGMASMPGDEWVLLAEAMSGSRLIRFGPGGDTAWVADLESMVFPAFEIAADQFGNSYVTHATEQMDYCVLQYGADGSPGVTLVGGSPVEDAPASVAVDSDGYPIVTGVAMTTSASHVLTVKMRNTVAVAEPVSAIPGSSRLRLDRNPTGGDFVRVSYSLPVSGSASLTVHDATGREVLRCRDELSARGSVELDLRRLRTGVYLVRLESGRFGETAKLVKTN